MELRVSVQSLIQQLVHEQAKASVNLEGLQRDVTTLLTFREHVMDSLPRLPSPPSEPPWKPGRPPPWKTRDSGFGGSGDRQQQDTMAALRARQLTTPTTKTPPLLSTHPAPAAPAAPSSEDAPQSSEEPVSPVSPGSDSGLKSSDGGSRWHDAGHSGASGNSTSGVGTSVGAGVSGGTSVGAGHTGGSGGMVCGEHGGEPRWADGDELLGLLDTIASRGRRLCDENRQLVEVLSHTELSNTETEEPEERESDPNVMYRCRYCERPLPDRSAAADPTRLMARDPVTDALNLNVHLSGQTAMMGAQSAVLGPAPLLGGQSPLLRGHSAHTGQSPLLGGQYPPGGGQYPPAAGQSPLLHGKSSPLGRSAQLQQPGSAAAAGCPLSLPVLRPRDEYISALTEVERLMQERDLLMERLLGMELVAVRSQGQAASLQTRLQMVSAANEELRRELRLASSSRCEVDARIHDMHQQFVRSRRPQPAAAAALAARSTPDLRLPSRIPQPLSLRRRAENVTAEKARAESAAGERGRLAETLGERGRLAESLAAERTRVAEERGAASEERVQPTSRTVQTQTEPVPQLMAVCRTEAVSQQTQTEPAAARAAPAAPDRARVAGILRETDPLRLQRQLLRMLVEAEVLRSQLSTLGRDPGQGQVTVTPPAATAAHLQRDNDQLRLQLAERQIELEGTRARLRQLELSSPSRARAAGRPASLSVSPHDRSLGHSSIPVLVRSASPARRGRRLSAGQAVSPAVSSALSSAVSSAGDGGPRSQTPSRPTDRSDVTARSDVRGPGGGRGGGGQSARPAGQGSEGAAGGGGGQTAPGRRPADGQSDTAGADLATVRAMRQLSWSLRRPAAPAATAGQASQAGQARVGSAGSPASGAQQDAKTKADWRASFPSVDSTADSSAKVPPTQSQAIGQILTALSAASSSSGGGGGADTLARTAADIHALRRDMELRLRAARADSADASDAEPADASLSTASPEPGRRGGLLERLTALDAAPPPPGRPAAVDSRFGYRHTGGSGPDPALMPPSQGLIHQILSTHAAPPPAAPAPAPAGRARLQKSVSLASGGERRAAPSRLTRSSTLRETAGGGGSPRPPAKESGNARVGRYIRNLLQRIAEVPDQ